LEQNILIGCLNASLLGWFYSPKAKLPSKYCLLWFLEKEMTMGNKARREAIALQFGSLLSQTSPRRVSDEALSLSQNKVWILYLYRISNQTPTLL
jgi:hypothetical protein